MHCKLLLLLLLLLLLFLLLLLLLLLIRLRLLLLILNMKMSIDAHRAVPSMVHTALGKNSPMRQPTISALVVCIVSSSIGRLESHGM